MSGSTRPLRRAFASRLRPPVAGGAGRQDSVRAGLEALATDAPDRVLIHDAARPFVEPTLITRVIASLDEHDAALPCLPVTDTLTTAKDGRVTGTLPRDRALARADAARLPLRCDPCRASRRGEGGDARPSPTMPASPNGSVSTSRWSKARKHNRKLTSAEDIASADELLRLRAQQALGTQRVATGYDVHAFGPGDAVILCGVRIPHDKKLIGHSDADVGMHALTDALLGTIADGDIGVHFPPSDARWRGAASELFLKDAAARCQSARRRDRACRHHLHLRGPAHRALSRCDAGEARRDASASTPARSASRRPPMRVSASSGAAKASPPWPPQRCACHDETAR